MSVVTTTLLSDGTKIDEAYELISIDVRREVNRIPQANLVLLDGDAAQRKFPMSSALHFEPGKEIEIKARYESLTEDATLFKGVVVRHAIEANVQGSLLRVEMKDAAVKLAQTRKSTVFRDQSDDEVVRATVQAAGLRVGTIDSTEPKHPQLVQYYCSDWDFIVSRADIQGLLTVAEDGEISIRKVDLSGAAPHTFAYGLDEIYGFEFQADAASQYPSVSSTGWSIEDQKPTVVAEAKAFSLSQGNLDGKKLAQAVGFGGYSLVHPVPIAQKELQAWADARLLRSRMSLLRGRLSAVGVSDIHLLELMQISGVGDRFNGKALITGICQRIDADGWRTDVQFGLSPRAFCLEDGIRDVPAAGLLPGAGGLQIGVVESLADDPDKQLRVKVRLLGFDSQAEALWARVSSPDAGKDRGYMFRPEVGDEVVVGFFNDDPRQLVILGALFSSKNSPPSDFSNPTEDNLKKGIVTKGGTKILFNDDKKASLSLETKGSSKILLDDDQELIEISDKHGNKITLDKNGIKLASAKDLKFEASGNVEIKGAKVDVK